MNDYVALHAYTHTYMYVYDSRQEQDHVSLIVSLHLEVWRLLRSINQNTYVDLLSKLLVDGESVHSSARGKAISSLMMPNTQSIWLTSDTDK